ncbi:MAG: FtsX-like permease family protein, partial [Longimicrobiales bacterium]
ALLEGRGFTEADRADGPGVAIVSRGLAEQYWPDEDVIGKRMKLLGDDSWRTIVGVAEDVAWHSLTAERGTGLYVPLRQGPTGPMRVVVRTTSDPRAFAANLRALVTSIDEDTPISDVRTMEQFVSASVATPRFAMLLVGLFAAVALALGAIGVYGVLAYTVSERTREIAVRMALGARASEVLRLVLRRGLLLVLAGTALGVASALVVTRLLSAMLFGVSAADPLTFAVVTATLIVTALAASYLPARRAARVEPMTALRHE